MIPEIHNSILMTTNHLRAMISKELSDLYQIDPQTLKNWLEPNKDKIVNLYGKK